MKLPGFLKKRRVSKSLLGIIIFLVAVRISLPYVILHFANKNLKAMRGYTGQMEDIDLALYRGAYKICDIYIDKIDSATEKQTPFMSARQIDLSIEWRALLRGNLVGELIFDSPEVRFTLNQVEPAEVQKDTADFHELLKDFMPLKINRLEMQNGKLRYVDSTSTPMVDIAMDNTYLLAKNLRNVYDSATLLPAAVRMTANIYEGSLKLNMKLNPLAEKPTFDLNISLDSTNLVLLNDFFKAYAKVDVNQGTFGLYSEVASEEGRFTGYVKPLIKELKVVGAEDRKDNLFRKMWEAAVGTTAELLENQKKDQFATRIPLEGQLNDPDVRIWYAMMEVLKNAFVRALRPNIENAISIGSIAESRKDRKFFKNLFDKKEVKQIRRSDSDLPLNNLRIVFGNAHFENKVAQNKRLLPVLTGNNHLAQIFCTAKPNIFLMRYLTSLLFLVAVVAAAFGSVKDIGPATVLASKICFVTAIILFLISLVTMLVKENVKTVAH